MKEKNNRTNGVLSGSASTPKVDKKSNSKSEILWFTIGVIVGMVLGILIF